MKRTKGEKIFSIFNYILLAGVGFVMLYPFLYTFTMSLSTVVEASKSGFHLFPKDPTLESYKMVFQNKDIFMAYGVTLQRTVIGTLLALIVQTMYAYALSRKTLPNKRFWSFIAVFTMLFSGGTIPLYLVVKNLNLLESVWSLILPCCVSVYNVIILQNQFNSIPESLNESAKLDGAGDFRIYWQIFMPLSKATLATVSLWIIVQHWNSWFDCMLYITDSSKQVLQIFLKKVVQDNKAELIAKGLASNDVSQFTTETVESASIIAVVFPVLCLYPFIQKYFVKGVMLGSVKG